MPDDFDSHYQQLLRRRRLLRRLLRPLPRRGNVRRYPFIKWFAAHAARYPYLWSFKRQHVLPALYAGSVLSLLPLYGVQLPLALGIAVLFRANLTITVALQFITNPLTIGPIYLATGLVGARLMETLGLGADLPKAMFVAQALLIGGVVVGLATALVADVAWRFGSWEARVFRARLQASRQRAAAAATTERPPPPSG